MKNEKFFCKGCKVLFDTPKFYEEEHGLDTPPYERMAVCPACSSDNFLKFDTVIEKTEVSEKLLPAIAALNRLTNDLSNIFGNKIVNADLSEGLGLITELISEMFCFIDSDIERKILKMDSEKDAQRVLLYLKGEL